MKALMYFLTTLVVIVFVSSNLFAEDHLTRAYVYKTSCIKTCHTNNTNGGLLKPESKTTSEWKELLKNNQANLKKIHKGINLNLSYINKKHPQIDKPAWNIVEEQLVTYAYDSDQPDEMLFR